MSNELYEGSTMKIYEWQARPRLFLMAVFAGMSACADPGTRQRDAGAGSELQASEFFGCDPGDAHNGHKKEGRIRGGLPDQTCHYNDQPNILDLHGHVDDETAQNIVNAYTMNCQVDVPSTGRGVR